MNSFVFVSEDRGKRDAPTKWRLRFTADGFSSQSHRASIMRPPPRSLWTRTRSICWQRRAVLLPLRLPPRSVGRPSLLVPLKDRSSLRLRPARLLFTLLVCVQNALAPYLLPLVAGLKTQVQGLLGRGGHALLDARSLLPSVRSAHSSLRLSGKSSHPYVWLLNSPV
ncbi:hypothetical protein SKAU_G00037250 [Synaphobranchus kaupii]|uniref:Uncharacterized protein n=1 Tax=Synaphobranchus kaupii TaxID=118154 RepID=A0A9Q1JGZ1_SYNKA|nr:hypothetical protein SKAU_G00037250 [Synaphobranchus kaupii]